MEVILIIIVVWIIFASWYNLTRTPEQKKLIAEQQRLANTRPVKRVARRKRKSGNDLAAKMVVKTVSVIGGGLIKGLFKAGKRR